MRDFFLEKQLDALDALIRMEALDHYILQKRIAGSQQDHALMVRHIRFYNGVFLVFRQARLGVVERLIQAKTTESFSGLASVPGYSALLEVSETTLAGRRRG